MSPAEQLAQGHLSATFLLEVLLKLGFVLALVYLSLRFLRNTPFSLLSGSNRASPPGPLRLLQVQSLNRFTTLYVIEVDKRRLLLSVQGNQVTPLSEWPVPVESLLSPESEPHES